MNNKGDRTATNDPAPPPGAEAPTNDPFHGAIEFQITIEMLGKRSVRRARMQYSCSPEWEHCDPKGELRSGNGSDSCKFEVMTRVTGMHWTSDDECRLVSEDASWEASALFDLGHVDEEAWQEVDRLIEVQVQHEDALRREIRHLPPREYPPFERGVPYLILENDLDEETPDDG